MRSLLLIGLAAAPLLAAGCGGSATDDVIIGSGGTGGAGGGSGGEAGGGGSATGGAGGSAGGAGGSATGGAGGSAGGAGGMGSWNEDYPSCQGLAPDACGGDNCCATDAVPGGWFAMGRGEKNSCASMPAPGGACKGGTATCLAGGKTWGCPEGSWIDLGADDSLANGGPDELPEHAARVDFDGLDRYEVTVGRMRRFVEGYDKAAILMSLGGGAGAHPKAPGTAWQGSWDDNLPADAAELKAALTCNAIQTWTDASGGKELYPVNCVSWYLAYAFCAWDKGRLPTAAEWERAAIGGEENRLYPWGTDAPSASLANFLGSDNTPEVDVFAKPSGAGRWGHAQIAGSIWEWVYDTHDVGWYAGGGNDCQNCANMASNGAKELRGGNFQYGPADLRGANRFPGTAGASWLGAGIRCARD